jgi:hypothetical protein
VRGPVGSLAVPEDPGQFEILDAGDGVIVYVQRLLMENVPRPSVSFQFGLLGRCTVGWQ